ncbi:MAG: hypothetical protein JWO83_4966 [Caulobacteraceae bacterium]|nr:hypothetical protein [Caulobacteraceae bacterium]
MSLFNLSQNERNKLAAWTACRTIQGFSESEYRIDANGTLILWSHYGAQSEYGWEIDHILPSALGGADAVHNYRALHWRTNRQLGGLLGNAFRAS